MDLTASSCDQYIELKKLEQFIHKGRSLALGVLVDILAMVLGVLFGCICMRGMPGFTPPSLYNDGPSQSVGSSFAEHVIATAYVVDSFTNASYTDPRELVLAPIMTVTLSRNNAMSESLDMFAQSSEDIGCSNSCLENAVPCYGTNVESGSAYFANIFMKPIYILSELHFPWDFETAPRRPAITRLQSLNNSWPLANVSQCCGWASHRFELWVHVKQFC